MSSDSRPLRLNGWGYADTTYPLNDRPYAWPHLTARLGVSPGERWAPVDSDAIAIRPSRLSAAQLAQSYAINETSADPGGIPFRWAVKSLIPLGFGLLALQTLAATIRLVLVERQRLESARA